MFEGLQRSLEELATDEAAANTRIHVRPLRGIRGVSQGILAARIAVAWREGKPELPDAQGALDKLFGTAWEDGLAAIALLAAALPSDPACAFQLGLDWALRTDDILTADSIGWLVLGPALAHAQPGSREASERLSALIGPDGLWTCPSAFTRRAAASSALAFTPAEIEGPAAAALREQQGDRHVQMVDGIVPERVGQIVMRFVRDSDPAVQKVLRRVLRVWAESDPASLLAWAPTVRGGLPKILSLELDRIKPRKPRAKRAAEEAP